MSKVNVKKGQKYVNFQAEQGGELGQPDWNFGPRYKKCTLAADYYC